MTHRDDPAPRAPPALAEPTPTPAPTDLVGAEVIATVWEHVAEPQGRRVHVARAEVVERFRTPRIEANKRLLAGWAPTTFRGDYRNLENVEASYAIGFDLDGEGTNLDHDAEALSTFAGFIYSSYRHTPERHRGRAIVWTSRPVLPSEYRACWSFVASLLPNVGQAAKDPSRLWFVPGVPRGGEYRLIELTGKSLDVDAVLAVSPETPPPQPVLIPSTPVRDDIERRARAYLATVQPAIEGSNGSGVTFRAAQVLMRNFGLDEATALRLLVEEYNPRCQPPWSEKELRHKIAGAMASRGENRWIAFSSSTFEEGASQWGGSISTIVVVAKYRRSDPLSGKPELHRVRLQLMTDDGELLKYQYVTLPIAGEHEAARSLFDATIGDLGSPEAWLDLDARPRLEESLRGRRIEIVLPAGGRGRAARMRRANERIETT